MNITQDKLEYLRDQINDAFMENRKVKEVQVKIIDICEDGDLLSCKINGHIIQYRWIQSDHCTLYLLGETLYADHDRYGIVNCIVEGSTERPYLTVSYCE